MLFRLIDNFGNQLEEFHLSTVEEAQKWYPKIPGVRYNFVISPDLSIDTHSDDISNEADRLLLRAIRSNADLIITTGNTARKENLKSSVFAPMLILTNQTKVDIPATRIPSSKEVLVTGTFNDYENPNAKGIGSLEKDLATWLKDVLKDYPSIVLESGITTAKEFSTAGLIQELCLSVTSVKSLSDALEVSNSFINELQLKTKMIQTICCEESYFFRFAVVPEN